MLTGVLVEDDAYAFACVTDGSRVVVVFNGAGAASAELHVPLEASKESERHAPGESAGNGTGGGGTPRRVGDQVAADPPRSIGEAASGH